jgi:pyrroline-5-carboxylate reductase
MEAPALNLGFDAETARQLSVETFARRGRWPSRAASRWPRLRSRVTSKGGTTEAALLPSMPHGVAAGIERGIGAADARGRELGDILGKD